MQKSFTLLRFPITLKVSSDSDEIPFSFFSNVIPNSKKIQFKLGYFNSNSIKTLSYGFAQFIYNGGTADFLTNHFLSEDDYLLLSDDFQITEDIYNRIESEILNDLQRLKDILAKKEVRHFYNCLRYLLDHNRITFLPVTTIGGEISHYKEALFWDQNDNVINIVGSCNFTYNGILGNGESFMINRSWGSQAEQANVLNEIESYKKIFAKKSNDFKYLDFSKVKKVIRDNSDKFTEEQLLNEVIELYGNISDEPNNKIRAVKEKAKKEFYNFLDELKSQPNFPTSQSPRDYQIKAYEKWVENQYSGVFAMATGTGKTKTALNCLLLEYKREKSYHAIILVPSIPLLNQWKADVSEFNFKNVLKVGGGNKWEETFANYCSNYRAGLRKDLIIIATYTSYCTSKFQKYFKKIQEKFTLIADEAHNTGAKSIKDVLKSSFFLKKIALSATLKRIYDVEGTEFINDFFKDSEPYTCTFTMKEALDKDFLTQYYYYPIIVELNGEEFQSYIELSKKLMFYFDSATGKFKDSPQVEKLLLLRKGIIHKAQNKILIYKRIISELRSINKSKYIFTYVPEGNRNFEDGSSEKIINEYLIAASEENPLLRINTYTNESDKPNELLHAFEQGKIDMLLAMKMLDEGVDIPRAEIGIFASSTGNPRQFIQRRGRLLRKHIDKNISTIYDMVVIPQLNFGRTEYFNLEKNLVKNELQRVGYFASLSINYYDSVTNLQSLCDNYQLDLDTIINEL